MMNMKGEAVTTERRLPDSKLSNGHSAAQLTRR